ncbi:MAG: metallophosphoesterase, partial [Ignavibacteria bacterium]|nr:metallophosphoesterase [Ignavibacteria bacterium]
MDYKRILVISDLHMTSGKDPLTGVWAATEDFFWDNDFKRFIQFYQNDSPSLLIINGDLFDFLQVLVFPNDEEKIKYNISPKEINYKYGLRTSENASVFQVDKIFEGHPEFFKALTSFISKGNYVKILKGNHDIQLFWPKVQEQIISNLEHLAEEENKKMIRSNLEFLPWFFYIPGKLYIEHGNQYEYTTSFRNFLYPYLPFEYEDAGKQIELDLSSFLIRYFSNKMESVNPLSDNIRPLSKYLGEFWKNYPYIFITSIGTAFRYLIKAFNKAGKKNKTSAEDEKNKELIKLEAAKFYSDNDKRKWFEYNLFKIDGIKAEPILSSGKLKFLWNMLKSPLKGLLWVLPLYALLLLPDITSLLRNMFGEIKNKILDTILDILFLLKIPEILIALLIAIFLISLRTWLRKRKSKKEVSESDEIRIKIRESAGIIADSLKVKFVVFGHTHYADINRLADNAFYYNTGTWMGIFAPEEELYRNVRQFTYFILEEEKGNLFHW